MARDKKLREVLDSLSGDPARSLPTQDRELMESVLRRLKIQENRRLTEEQEEPTGPTEEEMAEQELEELRQRQQHDSEEMQRLQEERERLLSHQHELEERLARLEAASHGGPLSYVEEEPEQETVEFSRVDLDESKQDELLEFNYLGQKRGFDEATPDAWEEGPAAAEPDWEDWPDPQKTGGSPVSWDEDEPAWPEEPRESPADAWETQETAPRWHEESASPTTEQAPPWSEGEEEEAWPSSEAPEETGWEEPAPAAAPTEEQEPHDDGLEALDDRTRAELDDLERQLAELEQEIERRGGDEEDEDEERA